MRGLLFQTVSEKNGGRNHFIEKNYKSFESRSLAIKNVPEIDTYYEDDPLLERWCI
jgi:hypothetical protein